MEDEPPLLQQMISCRRCVGRTLVHIHSTDSVLASTDSVLAYYKKGRPQNFPQYFQKLQASMQRFSFLLLLACLLRDVHSADPQPSGSWQRNKNAASRAADSFRPQPHAVRVENYRYLDETNSNLQESGGILEHVGGDAEQIEAASTTAEGQHQTKSTPFSQMAPLQRIKRGAGALPKLFDDVDRLIFATALPLSAVFAIIPITSALDLFWVNRLGDALAVAGQAAANQVFNSAFWLFAFLPTITATLVSKSHASGDIEQTQDAVCQALLFSLLIAIPGGLLMFFKPTQALGSILKGKQPYFVASICRHRKPPNSHFSSLQLGHLHSKLHDHTSSCEHFPSFP
jgi:hypothetical protein